MGYKGGGSIDWGAFGVFLGAMALSIVFGMMASLLLKAAELGPLVSLDQSVPAVSRSAWGFGRGTQPLSSFTATLGSLLLMTWFATLTFQGEGAELDMQRRRHPMWEWLLGHPVEPGAVFFAEMLSPLSANPLFWVAPVFWIGIFWIGYGEFGLGLLAGLLAGIPLTVAASCVSKSVEIGAMLRLPPRSRGAVLGLLAWIGMVAFYAPFFARMTDWTDTALTSVASVLEAVHLPFLDWALGRIGSPSWWKGVLACWGAAALLIAAAVRFSSRATNRGLAGGFSAEATAPKVLSATRPNRMLRDPVYRKELLWLWRDRGALVQVFLVPLTLAAVQLFNFRFMLTNAAGSWHLLAGGSVVFGSYFLLVLGPRSLLSEGPALWMPLTWPRGLEALLKAKARLWWICSLLVVGTLLLLTAIRFPADGWKVALTGALYALFSLSLSEKSVTLVTAPSSGGEPEPVPGGRRWATMLGTFTFGLGILTQQWHVAIYGVVFSWGSAAAIWQNFRARLPFLFDPWSERLPPAPTLMHAMIAITALVELTTIATAFFRFALGPAALVVGRSIAYGACAFIVFLVMNYWLSERKVPPGQIWRWDGAPLRSARGALGLFGGVMFGLILASGALGFGVLLEQLPSLSAPLRQLHDQLAANPADRGWMALLAVGFAPVAEEYLFRGLLFRALDREWGGAKAIWGSAAFFAIYHPPLSWLPVALVGAACAWLFKKTGRLLPSVLLHAAYNALLVWSY